MNGRSNPVEQRIGVADGLELRVLRRLQVGDTSAPSAASPTTRAASFVLVHGLASNARLWDGVANHLAEAGPPLPVVIITGHDSTDTRTRALAAGASARAFTSNGSPLAT